MPPDAQLPCWRGCAARGHCLLFGTEWFEGSDMTDEQGKGSGQAGSRATEQRQDRLKLALRENLKRRKSQARGREHGASSEAPDVTLDDADRNGPER